METFLMPSSKDYTLIPPSDSQKHGFSYTKLIDGWYKYMFKTDLWKHPLMDPGDGNDQRNCTTDQKGSIIYLGTHFGNFRQALKRKCEISQNQYIFAAILNKICDYTEDPQYNDDKGLKRCAKQGIDAASVVTFEIDRDNVPLNEYRVPSNKIEVRFTERGPYTMFGIKPDKTEGFADGYWVLIKFNKKRTYKLHSVARVPLPKKDYLIKYINEDEYSADVTYELTVK